MKNGRKWLGVSSVALAVAVLAGCGGGDDAAPAAAGGGGSGGGGGAASLTCNTSIVPGGTTPTVEQLTAFARTYQGEEGRYSEDFSTFTVEDPDADLVFAANGATYNGSALTITSACHEVLPGGAGTMLVIYVGTDVHFDLFSDGALAGIAPNGKAVRSPGG
jgi:hypothetical protein